MEVNDALLEKLAELSKLNLTEAEKNRLRPGLEEMIGFVNCLTDVDTTHVEPLLHMGVNQSVFRKDEAQTGLPANAVFQNAVKKQEPFFEVPKVIKNPD